MDTVQKITRARTQLLLGHPFFGTLALKLEPTVATEYRGHKVDTMATDGRALVCNPDYVERLTPSQLVGVLSRPVMHCALGHPWRMSGRDRRQWNSACNYVIDEILTEAGLDVPDPSINPAYAGMNAERVYSMIPAPPDDGDGKQSKCEVLPGSDQGDPGQGDQSEGEVLPGDPGQGESPEPGSGDPGQGESPEPGNGQGIALPDEIQWQMATIQAARAAKAQGKLPAGIDRIIDDLTMSRVDWRELLRDFAKQACRTDYTWRRPDRRFIAQGLYLPSLHNEETQPLAVAIDTSGSINADMLAEFCAEINVIREDIDVPKITVIYCDAKVNRVDTFERDSTVTLRPCGGGGTDFRPVFDHVANMEEQPAALVYLTDMEVDLTDMEGTFPDNEPEIPTMWINYGNRHTVAPFGITVPVMT